MVVAGLFVDVVVALGLAAAFIIIAAPPPPPLLLLRRRVFGSRLGPDGARKLRPCQELEDGPRRRRSPFAVAPRASDSAEVAAAAVAAPPSLFFLLSVLLLIV